MGASDEVAEKRPKVAQEPCNVEEIDEQDRMEDTLTLLHLCWVIYVVW